MNSDIATQLNKQQQQKSQQIPTNNNANNTDFIRRTPLSRHNSSLMDVIGIGSNNNNNLHGSGLPGFTAVVDPITTTTTTTTSTTPAATAAPTIQRMDSPFQRIDSPFQSDLTLQRTTSIFNENTNTTTNNNNTNNTPVAPINNNAFISANPMGATSTLPPLPPPPPPGVMINLYISQWEYIDHQGNKQGPFPSDMMSQWYHSNYFQPNLQITITNDAKDNDQNIIDPLQFNDKYFTLNDLILKVRNVIDPFATYDSIINSFLRNNNPITAQTMQPQSFPNMFLPNNNATAPATATTIATPDASGGGGSGQSTQLNTAQEEKSSRKTTEHDDINPNIYSGDYTFNEILNLSLDENAYYHQVSVPIPMQRKLKKKVDINTVIESGNINDPRINDIWGVKEIAIGNPKPYVAPIKDEEPKQELPVEAEPQTNISQEPTEPQSNELVPEQKLESTKKSSKKSKKKHKSTEDVQEQEAKPVELTLEEKRKIKAELMAQQLLEEEAQAKARQKEAKASKKSKKQKEKKLKTTTATTNQINDEKTKQNGENIPEETELEIVTTKPAPWAGKTKTNAGKGKQKGISLNSFFELQKNEELKQQKLEENRQLEAMKLSAQILKEEQEKKKNKSLLTWANSTNSPTNNDTIPTIDIKAQLLKDQEQKKKAKKESLLQQQPSQLKDMPTDPSFIEEQQRIWEQLQKTSKTSKSSSDKNSSTLSSNMTLSSNATTTATNAWTRVASTKTKKTVSSSTSTVDGKVNLAAKKPTKQIGSSTSIPALKNKFVSNLGTISPATMTTRTATPMYPGNSSISKRQEFLKWCKSQLRLNPGISHRSVLEVLLSLPAGPESNEIIADTIYSNSSIMDGRRFAVEFNKKRLECERQVTDPLSWSEALALPEGSDDDWEFQVVSKKKKGKKV